MAIRGSQQIWVAGTRLYLRRKSATNDLMIDAGTIKTCSPQFQTDKISLDDPDGGVKTTVFEQVTKQTEAYDITTANMGPKNLAILFGAAEPEDWSQTADPVLVQHTVDIGLVKLRMSSTEMAFMVDEAHVFPTANGPAIVSITGAVVKLTGDVTASATAGKKLLIQGNSTTANGVYTIASSAIASGNTDVTLTSSPASPNSSGTGTIGFVPTGNYSLKNKNRGLLAIPVGSAITPGTVRVWIKPQVVAEAPRLIKPQTLKGAVECTAILCWSRDGGTEESIREVDVSIAPSGANITADDTSDQTWTVTVLSDPTDSTEPAGRLLQIAGDTPPDA